MSIYINSACAQFFERFNFHYTLPTEIPTKNETVGRRSETHVAADDLKLM